LYGGTSEQLFACTSSTIGPVANNSAMRLELAAVGLGAAETAAVV